MSLSVEITNTVGSEWNQKLLECEYSTSFQTSEWCELYKKSFESKPFFISIKDKSGNLVGQMATILHRNYNWRNANLTKFVGKKMKLGSSLEWERGPIIHNDNLMQEITNKIFSSIQKICVQNNVSNIRGTSPTNSNISLFPFSDIDLVRNPWSTYIVKLKNKDELFNNLDKKTRYDIRKSEKSNLEFVEVKKKSDFIDYVKLKLEPKGNIGLKNYPDFFEQHWKLLHSKHLEQLFLAKFEEKIVSGILCSTFNENMIQHGVVTSNDVPISGSFLTWKTIQWGIENGFNTYDMGGVNPAPNEKEKGIEFFKSKWEGKKDDYLILTKILRKPNYGISRILQDPKKIAGKLKEKFG
ncbi:MAG: hypothetical protein HRO68_00715 [Nitrosopumilus sp.]|nr:hypothetical protein [Nitrosopumilus sp.]